MISGCIDQVDFAGATGKLEAIEDERDRLLDELKDERTARIEAEKDAANLRGQVEQLNRPSWWQRVRGRG